jgi:hypothetical protein
MQQLVRPTRRVALRFAMVPQFLGLLLLVVALLVSVGMGGRGTVSLFISGVAGVSLVVGMVMVWVRPWMLRLDEDGYRVRLVRGAGVSSARWTDVTEVATAMVAQTRCLVLRLPNDQRTIIPVDVLEGDPDELVRTIRSHLLEAERRPRS